MADNNSIGETTTFWYPVVRDHKRSTLGGPSVSAKIGLLVRHKDSKRQGVISSIDEWNSAHAEVKWDDGGVYTDEHISSGYNPQTSVLEHAITFASDEQVCMYLVVTKSGEEISPVFSDPGTAMRWIEKKLREIEVGHLVRYNLYWTSLIKSTPVET